MSRPSIYERMGTERTCPRCWNKEGLIVKCELEDHLGLVYSHVVTTFCPRCGWEPSMINNRVLHFLLEYQVGGKLGWKLIGRNQPNPLGVGLLLGLAYITVTYIVPQIVGAFH